MLLFFSLSEGYGQNKYRSLAVERTRYENNQAIFFGVGYSPNTVNINGGLSFFIKEGLQIGGGVSLGRFSYASYKERIAIINLESQYDVFKLLNKNLVISALGKIGFEKTFVTSETEIVLDRTYPFKIIPQIGVNSDFYITPQLLIFANFAQGYVVNSSYLDNWRYNAILGIKLFIGGF